MSPPLLEFACFSDVTGEREVLTKVDDDEGDDIDAIKFVGKHIEVYFLVSGFGK